MIGFSTFGRIRHENNPLPLIYADEFKWIETDPSLPLIKIKTNSVNFVSYKIPAG